MARNRQCGGCGMGCNNFVPWGGCQENTCGGCGNNNPCGNGCGNVYGNTCGTACGNVYGNACGTACGNTCACLQGGTMEMGGCPFHQGCPYPMTYEEMLCLLRGLRYGRLAVCVEGTAYVAPVCFSLRNCDDHPIFTLRLRTDGCLMERLQDCAQVTLQFDRQTNTGVCTVQVMGTVHVTGSTGCVAIVEVRADSMMGECFRRQTCGNCGNACGAAYDNGCGNTCGCNEGCGNTCI